MKYHPLLPSSYILVVPLHSSPPEQPCSLLYPLSEPATPSHMYFWSCNQMEGSWSPFSHLPIQLPKMRFLCEFTPTAQLPQVVSLLPYFVLTRWIPYQCFHLCSFFIPIFFFPDTKTSRWLALVKALSKVVSSYWYLHILHSFVFS